MNLAPAERSRLLKLGELFGSALRDVISVVTYRSFQRWRLDRDRSGKKKRAPNRNPRRTPEEIRELVICIARETNWGVTRILSELRKMNAYAV